ncbi:MAG: PIN domain-containing protein [Acidobacteriota bacterium]|nr:PIN domain-containing protein [Acidobacteriota bacterium]
MTVLVDTCIWSLALRRRDGGKASGRDLGPAVESLRELILAGQASLIGPIRQELLSGLRRSEQFEALRGTLRAFETLEILPEDYERAAQHFNTCRGRGIQGSNTDFLICAVAERFRLPIFTTDRDFQHFAEHLPVELWAV